MNGIRPYLIWLSTSLFLISCNAGSESGGDASAGKTFTYSGYTASKSIASREALIRMEQPSEQDKAKLDEEGFIHIRSITLFPDGKATVIRRGKGVDTSYLMEYEIAGDRVFFASGGENRLDMEYTGSELKSTVCNYGGFQKDAAKCLIPPPRTEIFADYFTTRDTLWAMDVEYVFSK